MTSVLRLELPVDAHRSGTARSFVSVVSRIAGVPEQVLGDLRVAAAELAGARREEPFVIRVEVGEDAVVFVMPLGPDEKARIDTLAGPDVGVETYSGEGTVRLSAPIRP